MIKSILSIPDGSSITVEPRTDTKTFQRYQWPKPMITKVVADEIAIPNNTRDVISIRKNEHICQVRTMTECEIPSLSEASLSQSKIPAKPQACVYKLHEIVVDPNGQLDDEWRMNFRILHEQKKQAFEDKIDFVSKGHRDCETVGFYR